MLGGNYLGQTYIGGDAYYFVSAIFNLFIAMDFATGDISMLEETFGVLLEMEALGVFLEMEMPDVLLEMD